MTSLTTTRRQRIDVGCPDLSGTTTQFRCVRTQEEFDQLRDDWERVYDADSHASLFVSWPWLRGWMRGTPRNWMVLAASSSRSAAPEAFVFLGVERAPHWYRLDRPTVIRLGGHPTADCAGFVCQPGREELLGDLARYVAHELRWDRFLLGEISDPRLNIFLRQFQSESFDIRRMPPTPCPQIELPASWESYVQDCLSAATRKTLRRRLRAIERMTDVRWTDIDSANAEEQVEVLLRLWSRQWPRVATPVELERLRGICRECFCARSLWLRVLWRGSTPMAAVSGFIDQRNGRFGGHLMGINDAERELSPGNVLIAHAIQFSIARGLRYFDFLRGDEPYKYSLGAQNRFNQNVLLTRHRWTTAVRIAAGKVALRTRTRSLMHRLRMQALG